MGSDRETWLQVSGSALGRTEVKVEPFEVTSYLDDIDKDKEWTFYPCRSCYGWSRRGNRPRLGVLVVVNV